MEKRKKIITRDGSASFFNSEFQEAYHSTSGAKEEALKKFAEPALAKIESLRSQQPSCINVLDICFGLGYNSAAVLDAISNRAWKCIVALAGLEKDQGILAETASIDADFESYPLIRELAEKGSINKGNLRGRIIAGDAYEKITELKKGFDIVLHDPFSVKKCPELWEKAFFENVFRLMDDRSVLTTYSCAREIRESLKSAGFYVEDGPKVGRRGPSTIATKVTTNIEGK